MSKYTIQLKYLVRQYVHDAIDANPDIFDYSSQAFWYLAYPRLGIDGERNMHDLQPYPIFDESHRSKLNNMIIQRYWNNEIGAETPGMFAWNLNEALNRIMPYYNALYASKLSSIMEVVTEKWHIANTDDIIRKVLNATTGTADTKYNQNASYTVDRDTKGTLDTKFDQTDKTERDRDDTHNVDTTSNTQDDTTTHETMEDTGTRDSLDRFLDTPQANVQNLDDGWLTNVRKIHEDTTENRTTDGTKSETIDVTGNEKGQATQDETTDYTSDQVTDTDTTETMHEEGSSAQEATTDLDTTSNSDTDDTTDRDLSEEGWRIDPQDWEVTLTAAKELFNIDRMIVEDPAVQECFMMVW